MFINNGNNIVTITTVSGTIANTFTNLSNRKLVHLYIVATTSTTVFSWKITDKNSLDVAGEEGVTGNVKIINPDDLPKYLYGNFTLTIYDADADEAFSVLLVTVEDI